MTVAHYRLFEPSRLRFRLLWIWLVLGHPESRGWLSIMDSVTFLQHVLMRFGKVNSALSCCAKPLTLVGGVAMIEWLGWKEYYFSVTQNDIHII